MFNKSVIQFQDKLYIVKRRIRETHNPIIDKWKETLRATTVLRKDGFFWFVDEIEEPEILELTPWETAQTE